MRRFAQGIAFRSSAVPLSGVVEAARNQTGVPSSLSLPSTDDGVSTAFPSSGERGGVAASAHPTDAQESQRGHRGPRRHRKGEADGLLQDIFNLEKQLAAEQQRHRLSVRASQLGVASPSAGKHRVSQTAATSTSPAAELSEAQGTQQQLDSTAPPRPPTSAEAAPVLSAPTAVETARAASRVRRLGDDDVSLFAKPAAPSPTKSAAAASPGIPSSWAPPFTVTSELLRSSLEGPASEVAFTLEELENTLFTASAEAEESAEAGTATGSAAAVHAPPAAPPPPPPPSPPPPATPAADAAGTSVPPAASSSMKTEPVKETEEEAGGEATGGAASASPSTNTAASAARAVKAHAVTPAEEKNSSAPTRPPAVSATPRAAGVEPAAPVLPPLLRCKLRGTTVDVTAMRRATRLSELLEALHEAVTFAESLPAAPSGAPREVRLRADTASSTPQHAASAEVFLSVEDTLADVTASAEERVRVQLLKESLLKRITGGGDHGLRFIAEVHVGSTGSPAELRDVAAELVLACGACEVHHVARLSTRLDGAGHNPVRLSFAGIGSGAFPAPATVTKIAGSVHRLLGDDAQRVLLLESLGLKADDPRAATWLAADLASSTMLCLHLLPVGVSTALLTAAATEVAPVSVRAESGVGQWWATLSRTLAHQWAEVRASFAASRASTAAAVGDTTVPLHACVTAAQVWLWTCRAVQQRSAADEAAVADAVSHAMRSAPVQRCRRTLALAGASFSTPTDPTCHQAARQPLVMEVSNATLAHTSVTDLASEIRDQPADVLLAVDHAISLQQQLKFLASLHLTDTGDHHCVTVLLSGEPQAVDECASLTRSSACVAPAQRAMGYGPAACRPDPCDPAWLQHVVEVSAARCATASTAGSQGPPTEVTAAVHFVTRRWHRPCVVTATSQVSAALAAAAQWQKGRRDAADVSPLVPLHHDAAGMLAGTGFFVNAANWGPCATAAAGEQVGVTFLRVLDAACSAMLREVGALSPAAVNLLSVAALQLDASAGGVFDTADRVCGEDVVVVVSAMEAAAAQHPSLSFASLPLLRWMVKEHLLFYQLNGAALTRFAALRPKA